MVGSGLELHHRSEPILRLQGLSHRPVTGANACADESPIKVFASIEEIIQIHRLVSAMKVADANVKDAGTELHTMIAWRSYGWLQIRELGQVQDPAHDDGFC
jgi:hypothetical protein